MELVLLLAALYLAQCVVHLSPSAVVFRRRGPSCAWRRGERLIIASPWPGRIDLVAERILPTEWLGRRDGGDSEPPRVGVRARRAVVGGRPLFRLSTPGGAYHLRRLLGAREDGGAPPGAEEAGAATSGPNDPAGTDARVRAAVVRALSLPHAQACVDGSLRESRVLGMLTGLYLLYLFVALPAIVLAYDLLFALALLGPVLILLHLAASYEFWRVHRRLGLPGEERATDVLMGLLYPPALLRSRHDVVQAAIAMLHPAAVGAVVCGGDPLRRLLAGEFAYLEGHRARLATPLLEREREQFLALVGAVGVTERELARSRPWRDEAAVAYCPRCESDFVRLVPGCPDCGSRLIHYARALDGARSGNG